MATRIVAVVVMVLLGQGAARAQIAGVWNNGNAPISIQQNGPYVTFEYITGAFFHRFSGRFVGPGEIEGRYAPRLNRGTGCETYMAVHISMISGSSFVLRWRALDSNCDLREGQRGEDAVFYRQ